MLLAPSFDFPLDGIWFEPPLRSVAFFPSSARSRQNRVNSGGQASLEGPVRIF